MMSEILTGKRTIHSDFLLAIRLIMNIPTFKKGVFANQIKSFQP